MDSIDFVNALLLLASPLIVAGILSSLLAFRFGGPLLLVFLGIGMLAGEDGSGGLPFEDYRLTYLIGSGALAIILFDGGLRTRIAALRGVLLPATLLATAGVIVTAGLTAARFEGRPEFGDRIQFSESAFLLVLDVDDDRVTRVGLLLEDDAEPSLAVRGTGPRAWVDRLLHIRRKA